MLRVWGGGVEGGQLSLRETLAYLIILTSRDGTLILGGALI